jgi:Rho termination factor, N-terminal domain
VPFFSFSILVPVDDLLTTLIVILSSSFILYLTVMFISGAVNRCQAPTRINAHRVPIQDVIVPFKRPLTGLTIRQLKQRARDARIRHYSRMRKPQLITALQGL